MASLAASLTARTRSSTTSPGMAAGSSCKLVRTARAPARHGRSAMRQGDFPAIARCRRCGRHGLAEGPAGPDSTALSPDEGGGGVAPAQPLPAAAPASRHRHRRARLGRCRPSSSPWPATAGEAPPLAARCRAPGTAVAVAVERPAVDAAGPAAPVAGLRGAGTGVAGLRPASAAAALVEPRAGRDGDLPGPARLAAAHEASPPLAWLPGSDQPTKQAGTAQPEPHRTRPPYSRREGLPGTVWCGR
jgi:hypothetical protein